MKTFTKLFVAAVVCASMVSCSSCSQNAGSKKNVTPVVKSQAELQQEALIRMHLDTLANDITKLKPVGILGSVKDGKIVLDEKEKQLKPDYLADPAYVSKLQTLSQKYRAIGVLAADKEIAKLYDMPVAEYDKALAKLYADVNDAGLKAVLDAGTNFEDTFKTFYAQCKENNRENLFWDASGAAIIEELYIASQNVDKFLCAFDDESASNTSYHVTLLSIAIEELAAINPEYAELNESLKPLQVINAINLDQLKQQLVDARMLLASSRAALLK